MQVFHRCAAAFAFAFLIFVSFAHGQENLPDSPSQAKHGSHPTAEQQRIQQEEQSQKILGVIPSYNVTTEKTALPLTPSDKFRLFARSTFGPFSFVGVGFQAALSQATNQFPEYGQGAEGYGKRYGAAFADQVSSGFFGNYAYPVLFRQDPRYYRSGEGSLVRRTFYALSQEVIMHKDGGGKEFGWSNVLGAFTSGAISNAYYPSSERGFNDTMSRSGIAVGYSSVGNLASEFWPDVRDKWLTRHKKKKDAMHPQE